MDRMEEGRGAGIVLLFLFSFDFPFFSFFFRVVLCVPRALSWVFFSRFFACFAGY